MEKHPFDFGRYMWCSPGRIYSCICPQHLAFDGERCVDPYQMPWYCLVGINKKGAPGLIGAKGGTRFLEEAQNVVKNGTADMETRAIVPMVGETPGLPTTLEKEWATGSMYWKDVGEMSLMRLYCGGLASHLGILFENMKHGAEKKPHHWSVYFHKDGIEY